MTNHLAGPVLVMGAGAIGGFVGGCLAASGVPVTFVGRPGTLDAWRASGLTLTDLDGLHRVVPAARLDLHPAVPERVAPALVLLAVKSGATAVAARELGARLPAGTLVLSLQNGVRNVAVAQAAAPGLAVLPAMVPYNVAEAGPGRLHRATEGMLCAARDDRLLPWVPVFAGAGVPLALRDDMVAVQWAKLLLNLNNGVNALSGLPLRAQLLDRDLRRCTAALMAEAVAALRAEGIAPARLTPLPAIALPWVLRLPTPLYRRMAARMLRIDEQARSSMAMDLARGRPTEADALYGEVLRLAQRHGTAAPATARIVELLQAWPAQPRAWDGPMLRASLGV